MAEHGAFSGNGTQSTCRLAASASSCIPYQEEMGLREEGKNRENRDQGVSDTMKRKK